MAQPRLLIIDDDELVAELIGCIGEKAGYEPTITRDFAHFKTVCDDAVNVVTIDLMMPDTDGIEVIRYLGQVNCQATIILISGVDRRVMASAEQLAIERGLHVAASLAKPLDSHALTALLREAGGSERQRQEEIATGLAPDELREAILRGELEVLFQPKVELASRKMAGFEAVLRLTHPEFGALDPATIVHIAEREGFVMPLTESVLETAFAQLAHWCLRHPADRVAVNLSGQCLDELGLPDSILARSVAHGIQPSRIILEITESCLAADLTNALDVTTRLRLKSFELSIDDFGTGCATHEQLRRLPFNELKVDRSFVHGMLTDVDDKAIVASTIELGRSLGMRVVAEGIETASQWEILNDLGCDVGQGFFIGAPMKAERLEGWLHGWLAA